MKKILVVDDSSLARMMIKKCMDIADSENEHSYSEAGDGKAAEDVLLQEKFDLVISDLNMPNLTGEELLSHIKNNDDLKDIPVVLISSKINDAKSKELIELGAKGVLKKPLTTTALFKLLQSLKKDGAL